MMKITTDDHTPNVIPELNSQPTKYICVFVDSKNEWHIFRNRTIVRHFFFFYQRICQKLTMWIGDHQAIIILHNVLDSPVTLYLLYHKIRVQRIGHKCRVFGTFTGYLCACPILLLYTWYKNNAFRLRFSNKNINNNITCNSIKWIHAIFTDKCNKWIPLA